MSASFGTRNCPAPTRWDTIRKGPMLEVVREHVRRTANYKPFMGPN